MNIPTWLECVESVEKGTATPLEVFIFDNEPAGEDAAKKFRDQLQKMVNQVFTLGQLSEFDAMD